MPGTLSLSDLLYAACSALLLGAAAFVWSRDTQSRQHRVFALTALSLLAWVATLFLFNRTNDPQAVLWIGRANFAAVALAAPAGYFFVRAVAGLPRARYSSALFWQVLLVTALTALTPLVDQAELVGTEGSDHVTVFGPAFPLYILHVLGYLGAAVALAFSERQSSARGPVRDQLALIGMGILATAAVGLVTNVFLPYAFGNFRYTDAGPYATVLLLLAVGYAVVRHRLFDIRVLVRRTLVLGIVLWLVLAAYGALVVLATERLAGEGADAITRFGVLIIASGFDPFRRFLEARIDDLLFRRRARTRSRQARA